jgi:hypothetical protein
MHLRWKKCLRYGISPFVPGCAEAEIQGKKLNERFMAELERVHVQLGELRENVKNGSQDMWLWWPAT